MEESVFTKIIKGELPCHKLYEDDLTISFLTIQPVAPGHALVVPKIQVDQYIDLPDEYYDAIWRTVKKVAARLRDVTGKDRVEVGIKGTDVPHTHVHLIPFDNDENIRLDGATVEAAERTLAEMAEKLRLN